MYYFHPTPDHIVKKIVRRHTPKKFSTLLDPSIGDGALLKGVNTHNKTITCVDIDPARLDGLNRIKETSNYNRINADFLDTDFGNSSFDFILCNPPFDGRKQFPSGNRRLPIEAAFLEKALRLCNKKARLIFILPSSVTRGIRLKWFRELILSECVLSYSYKLPCYTFDNVEGDFSVLVFDKGISKKKTVLRFKEQEIIVNDLKKFSSSISFDAEELVAQSEVESLFNSSPFYLEKMSDVIDFKRGDVKNNYKRSGLLHSTNIKENLNQYILEEAKEYVSHGDWLIKRVSRDLLDSLREFKGSKSPFTDCVIRMIAKPGNDSYKIFFSLSVILQIESFRRIVIKGTGAKYLDLVTLKNSKIPLDLADYFPTYFSEFLFLNDDEERLRVSKKVAFIIQNRRFFSKEKLLSLHLDLSFEVI